MPRPFEYGDRNWIDDLNDLYNGGSPRVRVTPSDPTSAGVDVSADRQLVFDDIGCTVDVTATCNLTFNVSTIVDGWGIFVNVITGTATINVGTAGAVFKGGVATTKTITAGNGAYISSDGTAFRIFRFTAT